MRKPRFVLKVLLAVPICVAAFYVGWTTHATRLKAQFERDSAAAQRRRSDIQEQLAYQREVWEAHLKNSVDHLEQRERMRSFNRLLNDPNASKVLPSGTF